VAALSATAEIAPVGTIVTAHSAIADAGSSTFVDPSPTYVTAHVGAVNIVATANVAPAATVVSAFTSVGNVGSGSQVEPLSTLVLARSAVASIAATANVAPSATYVQSFIGFSNVGSGGGVIDMLESIEHLIRTKLSSVYSYASRVSLTKLIHRWKDDNPSEWPDSLGDRQYWNDQP
jgi:hypothetical protein